MPSVPLRPRPDSPLSPERQVPHPRRPAGLLSLPTACSTPPSARFSGSLSPGRGAGHQGCGRTPPRVLTSARASVRQRSVCCWDCGAGEAPTDPDRASPLPEYPDPSVALSGGAGTRGQAPRGREEAAPVGHHGAGRGRWPGPARRRLRSDSLQEQRRREKAWRPPPPGPGPELELVLDTLSGRWRGNPSELGRGLIHPPPILGRGQACPPRRQEGAWHPQVPRALLRPMPPWTRGLCGSYVPSESWGADEASVSGSQESAPAPPLPPHPGPGPQPWLRGARRILCTSRRRLYSTAN